MEQEKLKAGIYAIINKKLNTVYVGETQVCFLTRWIEHISKIPDYMHFKDRILLYLDEDTQYIVLKELDPGKYSKKEFFRYEYEAIAFYRAKGWMVVSRHSYSANVSDKIADISEDPTTRYRKAIKHMVRVLGLIGTSENNMARLYAGLYNKVNKQFDTNVRDRPGKNVLSTLTKEELEFLLLDLFPRYYAKNLAMYRKEYEKMDKQLTLFD